MLRGSSICGSDLPKIRDSSCCEKCADAKRKSYEEFLLALMKMELDSRMESSQRRKIRAANFPYMKTIDELDCSRFEHLTEAFIHELASCDFVSKRQNIVMIGNPGTGNYRKFLFMEKTMRIYPCFKPHILILL